jgi:LuxR family maltose regulon positive regulatory protein
VARAVGFATSRRILRPFRDRAELIAGVVSDTRPRSWGFSVEAERQFFLDICRGLPLTNQSLLVQLEQMQVEVQLLAAPTARELELLSLVETGLSNQQLADRLNLSVSTVKAHLFNLYTKLGVTSRSAALARARALNLLSR